MPFGDNSPAFMLVFTSSGAAWLADSSTSFGSPGLAVFGLVVFGVAVLSVAVFGVAVFGVAVLGLVVFGVGHGP